MVRVFFVYNVFNGPYGGANSFNKNLKSYFIRHPEHGIQVVENVKRADCVLVNAATRGPREIVSFSLKRRSFVKAQRDLFLYPWQLNNLKAKRSLQNPLGFLGGNYRTKVPVVQRLDGITTCYDGRKGGQKFDRLQINFNRLVDFTVFQSFFSRDSFLPLVGRTIPYAVILNGTDGEIFKWVHRQKPKDSVRVFSASWSGDLKKGHEALATLSQIPNVEVTFVGRWPENLDPKNVRIGNVLSQNELAEAMAQHHLFAHFSKNDNSPNIVVEALATGLPILYLNSGGTPEIVGESQFGEPVQEGSGQCLSGGLDKLMGRYETLIQTIRVERRRFLIEHMAEAYSKVFQDCIGKMK